MSTISKLPGRLRLKITGFINKKEQCRVMELKILEIKGVIKTKVNCRTGRMLVVFDEETIDSGELVARVREIFADNRQKEDNKLRTQERTGVISNIFVNAAIGIAVRAFIPKPWNALIPIAINIMRTRG